MGESIENQLKAFGAEDLNCNKYGESFKFPDDGVIKTPRCVYGHDYADNLEGPVRLEVASVNDQLQRLSVARLPVTGSATDRSDQTLAFSD
ncbi:hypothetical protein Bca52824_073452 [Brassica carinata]|uniref:Uncharacterized protein n=1 Tax=Brassica carinata TaxID=52824 RepID=A0A8X7QE29_BRACI|nr:hypothetical protein Bca52824_073452 [Brassica carinata]